MRKPLWAPVLLLAAVPVLSTAQEVSVKYDKTYDFSQVKTVAVQVGSQAQNPFLEKYFVNSVTLALTAKGRGAAAGKILKDFPPESKK